MDDVGFDLAGHTRQCIAHTGEAGFVFVANRQMQCKIPVNDQVKFGELLR